MGGGHSQEEQREKNRRAEELNTKKKKITCCLMPKKKIPIPHTAWRITTCCEMSQQPTGDGISPQTIEDALYICTM